MVMYGRYLKKVAVLLCALCMYVQVYKRVEGSDDKPWKNVNAETIFSVTYKHILFVHMLVKIRLFVNDL